MINFANEIVMLGDGSVRLLRFADNALDVRSEDASLVLPALNFFCDAEKTAMDIQHQGEELLESTELPAVQRGNLRTALAAWGELLPAVKKLERAASIASPRGVPTTIP